MCICAYTRHTHTHGADDSLSVALSNLVFTLCVQVRIQETQAELPRGSIPRSLEIVLRAEAVETAQAGDRCDFTGTLIVVPDVSQLRTPGMLFTITLCASS